MTGNSASSPPFTPYPDPPDSSDDQHVIDAIRPSVPPRDEVALPRPDTASADDLGLLLSDPDPFLSDESGDEPKATPPDRGRDVEAGLVPPETDPSLNLPTVPRELAEPRPHIDRSKQAAFIHSHSSENGLDLPVAISPCPDLLTRSTSTSGEVASPAVPDRAPRTSWPRVLVTSYASAVTLALIWVLWTGRELYPLSSPSESGREAGLLESRRGGPVRPAKSVPPLPARNVVAVGTAIRLGDVEVLPGVIARRSVDLVRLDGFTGETREVESVLVLSLRLTNRSAHAAISPLEPAFVRDPSQGDDRSFLETGDGRRISMLRLATESEWSISDQHFPMLKPGEAADTIIVTEPVQPGDLAGTLTWHVKLRTGTYQTDVVGVRFKAADVSE